MNNTLNKVGFSLQSIVINIEDKKNLSKVNQLIKDAMQTYNWIYRKEGEHDVMVKILIKEKFFKKSTKTKQK